MAEHELPAVTWTDNGGEAKNVNRKAEFAAQNKRNLDRSQIIGVKVPDCERYILQVDDTALPSVCVKTYQAMHCFKGAKKPRKIHHKIPLQIPENGCETVNPMKISINPI